MPADLHDEPISPARGFMAEHAHYDDDRGFWEAQADRLGGPVADLGAAAGRVTVRVASRGHEVWAVDTDPEMLEVLGAAVRDAGLAHLVHPVRGSMTDPLPASGLGLVMIPMNSLQLLRDPGEQRACLLAAATALRPGGEMIFDLAMPSLDAIQGLLGTVLDTGHAVDPSTGDLLLHTAVFDKADPGTGNVLMRIVVDRIHPDGSRTTVTRPHNLHLYDPDEIPPLAAGAGLEVAAVHGGFHGEPLGPDCDRHVWRLRKPEAA